MTHRHSKGPKIDRKYFVFGESAEDGEEEHFLGKIKRVLRDATDGLLAAGEVGHTVETCYMGHCVDTLHGALWKQCRTGNTVLILYKDVCRLRIDVNILSFSCFMKLVSFFD